MNNPAGTFPTLAAQLVAMGLSAEARGNLLDCAAADLAKLTAGGPDTLPASAGPGPFEPDELVTAQGDPATQAGWARAFGAVTESR